MVNFSKATVGFGVFDTINAKTLSGHSDLFYFTFYFILFYVKVETGKDRTKSELS